MGDRFHMYVDTMTAFFKINVVANGIKLSVIIGKNELIEGYKLLSMVDNKWEVIYITCELRPILS